MRKTILRIFCFGLILVFVLGYTNRVLKVKHGDGIYDLTKFYELEDNTVDVLILGSSHAFEDFNTGILWDEYGIASFILGGSSQPMWNTYFYLKEALKTQTPKLIILEAYMTQLRPEYVDDSTTIKNTFGMKWSLDKLEAIKVSSPKERWSEFLLEYVQYHTRYSDLGSADFYKNQGNPLYENWKGFGLNTGKIRGVECQDVSNVTEMTPLSEKTEKYFRQTIELAKEKEIPMLIVISPYAGINAIDQSYFNATEKIAQEYDVPFINYNLILDEIGIEFPDDAADSAHLNHRGSSKFSNTVGKYIIENYSIPDHRGEERYISWEKNAYEIDSLLRNQALAETYDVNTFLSEVTNKDYRVIVSVDGTCSIEDENVRDILLRLGIPEDSKSQIWFQDNEAGIIWENGGEESVQYFRMGMSDICIERKYNIETQKFENSIIINNREYKQVENGVNIVVYDKITEEILDVIGIDSENEYAFSRMFNR